MEPLPFGNLRLGPTASALEKKLFVYKVTCLSACIVSTAVNFGPFEPYPGAKYFGIIMPAFTTGYIIINASEIIAMHMKHEHIFLEVCFAVIGAIGNGICGIYQLWKWIRWMSDLYIYGGDDYGIPELVQATACFLHAICLGIIVFHRTYKKGGVSNNAQ